MLEKQIELNDEVTGEIFTVKESIAWTDKDVELSRYKSNYNPQSNGIGELNKGPFLVDDTGYVPLDEILKRCIRNGVNPIRPVDGEFTEDDVMSSYDELSTTEVVPSTQTEVVDNSSVDNAETLSTQSQEQTISESE